MVNLTILAGGFSAFIATYVFDSDAGTLNLTKQTRTGANPSWIAPHQFNSSILYAVNEVGPVGALQSFTVDAEGVPSLVDTIPTSGNSPTFTQPLLTGEVTGINFGSPNASFIATDPDDPTRFLPQNSSVVQFPVNGGPSNPHMSLEYNDEVLIADFGADKIWRVGRDGVDGSFKVQGEIRYPPGNGPRHLAIRNDILFVIHEKTSVLTAQAIPPAPNGTALPILANVSIVPEEASRLDASFFAAEIVISEPSEKFPEPLIYVSNRNLGPQFDERGDTIAIFEYSALRTGGGVNSSTTILAESVPVSTVTDQPSSPTSPGAPNLKVFTTLVPAPAKRMVRSHVHRRAAYEEARRQYEYGGYGGAPEPSSSPSSAAASGPPVITLTTNPIVAAASATVPPSASTTVAGPVMASSTPTAVTLRLVNQVHTGLRQIRSFAIGKLGTEGEEFLIAGANTQGGVAVFQRTDGGRNLTLVARNTELQNRTSFVFL